MTSFKRWLGAGAIVLVALALVACPALVPKATGSIPAMTFAHDDMTARTVALGSYFTDDDNATYKPDSSNPAVATASIAGTTLTVTPKGAGTTTVTVTATSSTGRDSAEQSFTVTVEAEPDPEPVVNLPVVARTQIDNMSIVVGMTKTLTLSDYYLDPDALINPAVLTYTAISNDTSIATVSAPVNSVITITAVAVGGPAIIAVTAADATGIPAPQSFAVTVTAENQAPVWRTSTPIGDVPYTDFRREATLTYTLSEVFRDPDNDALVWGAESDDSSVVSAMVDQATSVVTLTAESVGMTDVTVSATDIHGASVEQTFNVQVGSQAPEHTNVSNVVALVLQDGMRTETLDLMNYFSDPEGDDLTFAIADAGDDSIATVTEPDAMYEITITAVAVGSTEIEVTAADSDNDPVSLMLDVRVSAVPNQAPEVVGDGIPNQSLEMDFEDAMKELDLSMYFTDPDGDDENLSYTAISSDDSIASVSEPDADSMITITAMMASDSAITVTVTASDGEDMVSDMFTVMVSNPPVPTRGSDIGRHVFDSDDRADRDIVLMSHFNNATRYTAMSDDENVVTAEVDDDHTKVTLTPVGAGTAEVTVTPMNSGGSGPSQSFTVEVMAAPMKPVLKDDMTFSDIMLLAPLQADGSTANDAADTMKVFEDLNMYFEDPDKTFGTKALTFSTTTDEDGKKIVTVKEEGTTKNKVTLTAKAAGTATITITATDGDGLSSDPQMFMVTVSTNNSAPNRETTIEAGVIKDVDGDPAEGRLDIGDVEKVIDDKLITALFDDPDMARTATARGDTLKFELKFYGAGATPDNLLEDNRLRKATNDDGSEDTDYQTPLADDKAQVTGTVSPTTWDGTVGSKMTVTLTALRGSTADTPAADVVAIIATDEFGLQTVQVFSVRVNSPMKAEGAQGTTTPAGKPARLSGTGDNKVVAAGGTYNVNNGVLEMTWDTSGNDRTVALVAADAGHFHDPDGDAITCSYVRSPADNTKVAGVTMAANLLTIAPVEATGMMTVTVTCKDTVGTRFGPSVSDTLTVRVTGKTFSQR